MKIFLFFLSLLGVSAYSVLGQPLDTMWTRLYERSETQETVVSVEQNTEGYFLLSGTASDTSGGNYRPYLLKIDSQGVPNWFREYGQTGHDYAFDGAITSDGGYLIVGASISVPPYGQDAFIIRTNSIGDTLWTRRIDVGMNLNIAYSAVETDSGYYIAGSGSTWNGEECGIVIRLLSNGDTLWTRMYCQGIFGSEIRITSIIECFGGLVLGGSIEDAGALNGDFYLVHIDMIGDTVWTLRLGQSGIHEYVTDLGSSGDLYVLGMQLQAEEPNVILARVNSSGDSVWTKQFHYGYGENAFTTIRTLSPNRFAVFGQALQNVNSHLETQATVILFNSEGDTLWSRSYSVPNPDYYTSGPANITNDYGYILSGICDLSISPFSGQDLFLIRTERDETGSIGESWTIPTMFHFEPCYPNPTNGAIVVPYTVCHTTEVDIDIFSIEGKNIISLHNGLLQPGKYFQNIVMSNISSGRYYVRLTNRSQMAVQPILFVK